MKTSEKQREEKEMWKLKGTGSHEGLVKFELQNRVANRIGTRHRYTATKTDWQCGTGMTCH